MYKKICWLEYRKFFKNDHSHRKLAYVLLLALTSFLLGVQTLGLMQSRYSDNLPSMLIMAGVCMVLLVSLFNVADDVFSLHGMDFLLSLPMESADIAAGKIQFQYLKYETMSIIVLLPSILIYGMGMHESLGYYGSMLLHLVCVPMIPLVIAMGITIWTSRIAVVFQHKRLVQIVVYTIVLYGAYIMRFPIDNVWLFSILSMSVYICTLQWIVARYEWILFLVEEAGVNTKQSKKSFGSKPVLLSLYYRERKRFFASAVYAANALSGPVLATLVSMLIFFEDFSKYEAMLPFVWVLMSCLLPACAVSISLEGRSMWQIQCLPLNMKEYVSAKLLWNLTLLAPAYLIFEIEMMLRFGFDWMNWIAALIMMVFCCVYALWVDLKYHTFAWDHESQAVKQSMSSIISSLGCVLMNGFMALLAYVQFAYSWIGLCFIAGLTLVLYFRMVKQKFACL